MQIQPYLFFEGRCEEAAEFYRGALGAEVMMLMRYKDSPEPPQNESCTPADKNKVMHMSLRIGETIILASDGQGAGQPKFQGFALSLIVADEREAAQKFNALSEGGQSHMPLGPTFFSPSFGMVTDRFGVLWMVYVPQ